MKTLINKLILICFSLLLSIQLQAQDIVQTYLTSNPIVTEKWNEKKSDGKERVRFADTIEFGASNGGILDDFSYPGPYPDFSLWLDSLVFVNRTYAYSPPTIGVATFDGLNKKGYPYDFTASESSSKGADTLTSKPINLNYPASDSIYLSFYYQPQGRGNSPALKDSLVLEFKASGSKIWDHIWSKTGSAVIFNDTLGWKIIMIPITKTNYLTKGFQFRFRNYATVSGNLDHWHIDYVYLNRKRYKTDTNFEDVTYVYDQAPLIKSYYAMPWKQYTTDYTNQTISTLLRNNHKDPKNVNFFVRIEDQNAVIKFDSTDNKNVDPFSKIGYFKRKFNAVPALPSMTGPTSYFVKSYLKTAPDKKNKNDTLFFEQKFGNYFAYDDGTAESAFGLIKPNAYLAIKFQLNVADSLRYVDIYFNPILTNAADYKFSLKVWADAGTEPGSELASSRELQPRYTGGNQNAIIRYALDAPLGLSKGVFYVGFMQTSNKPLNVGLDLNNNNQFNTFYNVGTGWNTSPYPGTAIFHPVFGSDSAVTAISKNNKSKLIEVYPNPATTDLNIRSTDANDHKLTYSITDTYGREVNRNTLLTPAVVDISNLSKGIYFIHVVEDNNSSTFKFIKLE